MKRFIAALVAAAVLPAYAEVVAIAPKKAGGDIVLTDVQGKCPARTKMAFARDIGGRTTFGCWTVEGYYIVVAYNDGDVLTYDVGGFTMSDKYRNKKNENTF